MPKFDAILPAGGTIGPEFAEKVGARVKALIPIGGQTVLGRTLDALEATGLVARTVVIGPDEVLESPDGLRATHRLPPGETGPDNIFRGLDLLLAENPATEKVLVVTTDLPFLTGEVLRDFIERCPADRDICVPLIREQEFHRRFPGTDATFVTLRDDAWTTGCAYLMDVKAMRRAKPHIDRVFENRKSKMGMARLLGPGFVLKWLTKRLTLSDVEAKITSILGCTGAAVTGAAPELTFDIDYPEDYDYAVRFAAGGAA